jgi:DNA-binding transcriptional ArsR family regulator
MNSKSNPYAALERLFHEPNRLAIMSSLCGAVDGMSFTQLKQLCSLTDGNLSRHLHTLEEAGAIELRKAFVGVRPRTTVFATDQGRDGFMDYLEALEAVLKRAAGAVAMEGSQENVAWQDAVQDVIQG